MESLKGVWHLSEGSTLYLCITSSCKCNHSKGVWHLSEGGTLSIHEKPPKGVWHLSEGGYTVFMYNL